MIQNPRIEKHLVVALPHISLRDVELLDLTETKAIKAGLAVWSYDYGWYVHIPLEFDEHLDTEAIEGAGFSPQFVNLLEEAQLLGCRRITFEESGNCYADLETFDWDRDAKED